MLVELLDEQPMLAGLRKQERVGVPACRRVAGRSPDSIDKTRRASDVHDVTLAKQWKVMVRSSGSDSIALANPAAGDHLGKVIAGKPVKRWTHVMIRHVAGAGDDDRIALQTGLAGGPCYRPDRRPAGAA